MDTSVEGAAGESRELVPSGAKPIFDAFLATGADASLAYAATRSIHEMATPGACELSRRLVERTQVAVDDLAREMRAGFKVIERRIEQHNVRLDRQSVRIRGMERRIRGLEGQVGNLERRIGGLEGRIDRLDRQITAQRDAVFGLRGDVRELAGRYRSIDDRLGTLTMVTRWGIALLATALGIGAMVMVQLFVLGRAEILIRRQPIAIEEPAAAVPAAGSLSGDVASSSQDGQQADAESPE